MNKNKIKLTIAGAGSTYTTDMIVGLIKEKDNFPVESITLYDIDAERQNKVFQISKKILASLAPEVTIHQTTDYKEGFKNCDFVFAQIREGGLALREHDEMIPLMFGCVGQETCGAGGAAYGLRSIAGMIDLVTKIREVNKDCWILNYSNPAAIVAIALDRQFPDDKRILNICDMPVEIMEELGKMVNKSVFDLEPYYFGLNHFGWFTRILTKDGEDITEDLKKKVTGVGIIQDVPEYMQDKSWEDTYKQLGITLADFNDYIPNTYLQYYLYPDEMVAHSDIHNVRARQVMNGREKRVFEQGIKILDENTVTFEVLKKYGLEGMMHGRYMIRVAASLAYNERMQAICIQRNNGCISGLPDNAMVEVPCILTNNGLDKLHVGNIPLFYQALLFNQNAYEQLLVDAWFNHDKATLLKSFVLNRTIVDTDKAKEIIEKLIEVNGEYFPEFK